MNNYPAHPGGCAERCFYFVALCRQVYFTCAYASDGVDRQVITHGNLLDAVLPERCPYQSYGVRVKRTFHRRSTAVNIVRVSPDYVSRRIVPILVNAYQCCPFAIASRDVRQEIDEPLKTRMVANPQCPM